MPLPAKILEFPVDGRFWFVKWIDEFTLPHLGTDSASVKVILQKLPISKATELSRLKDDALLTVLGQRSKGDPEPEVMQRHPVVLAGLLPALHIGAVFHNQEHIGDLPSASATFSIPGGEVGLEEFTLGQSIPPPANWTWGPYRLLNKFEYSVVPFQMKHSKCLVIERENTSFIIPRMTMFKAFYGMQTIFANAFSHGSWPERMYTILSDEENLESGQKTEITADGKWGIVLQTKVKDQYACWAALYYHDEYARTRATEIYSLALAQRRHYDTKPNWYASARLPFKESEDVRVQVRGFKLREWTFYDENNQKVVRSKFLVTEIVKHSWPSWIPTILHGRTNNNERSPSPIATDAPRPFSQVEVVTSKEQKPIEVDNNHDADSSTTPTDVISAEMSFLGNGPKLEKMPKKSSKTYGPKTPPKESRPVDKVSMGELRNKGDAVDQGAAEVVIRDAEKRFGQVMTAFLTLRAEKKIADVSVESGASGKRAGRRGELDVWQFFFPEGSAEQSRPPARCWRYIDQGLDDDGRRRRTYRTALVLRVVVDGQLHYWIEIECRKTETGFRSIVLSDVSSSPEVYIAASMEMVANHKGRNMDAKLNEALGDHGVTAGFYRHQYQKDVSPKALDTEYILNFLQTYKYAAPEE
ncbi:hypothetical protein [Herbaspirillum chlorophenolicum]|uniref:hypothetical protein n=1 Tax=Herbaspirillum chlorophenolicum TaxID=211589 RepID=UPI00067E36C8|nr:hypothetical protein [Herbaspirillum chlorophenolicum]